MGGPSLLVGTTLLSRGKVDGQRRQRTQALEAKIAWDPGASWAWGPGRVERPTCFALGARRLEGSLRP